MASGRFSCNRKLCNDVWENLHENTNFSKFQHCERDGCHNIYDLAEGAECDKCGVRYCVQCDSEFMIMLEPYYLDICGDCIEKEDE